MPLAGEQLTIKEALALCYVVGFRKAKLVIAVAVMTAESGRYVEAWHDNIGEGMDPPGGTVLSTDRGLFQINTIHESLSNEEAYEPVSNALFAFQLSKRGEDFSPWAAYNHEAHLKFMEEVQRVKDEGIWKSRQRLWVT